MTSACDQTLQRLASDALAELGPDGFAPRAIRPDGAEYAHSLCVSRKAIPALLAALAAAEARAVRAEAALRRIADPSAEWNAMTRTDRDTEWAAIQYATKEGKPHRHMPSEIARVALAGQEGKT